MDNIQNAVRNGGEENVQTSAGQDNANPAGLEIVNAGVPPRAARSSDVCLPQIKIARLNPATIEGVNALSDEEIFWLR